jgi:hypothetical protein
MAIGVFVRRASPSQEVERVFDQLFDGIPLSDGQAMQARYIISRYVSEQRAILPRGAGWGQYVVLHAERDDALISLLSSESQRAPFVARAAKMRRMLGDLDVRGPQC